MGKLYPNPSYEKNVRKTCTCSVSEKPFGQVQSSHLPIVCRGGANVKIYSMDKVLSGAIFGIVASVSLLANADDYGETYTSATAEGLRTVAVGYGDLNLASNAGQLALQRRINRAAQQVCGSAYMREAGSLRQASDNRNCQERAISEVMDQLSKHQIASTAR